jgi:hypothetical protein
VKRDRYSFYVPPSPAREDMSFKLVQKMREKQWNYEREKIEKNKIKYGDDAKNKTPSFSSTPSTPSLFLSSLSSAAKNFALKNTPLKKSMDVNNKKIFSKSTPSINSNITNKEFYEKK